MKIDTNDKIHVGQIIVLLENKKYSFYIVLGYKKEDLEGALTKSIYNRIIHDKLCLYPLLDFNVKAMTKVTMTIIDESTVLDNMMKSVRVLLKREKSDVIKKKCRYLDNCKYVYKTEYRIRKSALKKLLSDNFVSIDDIVNNLETKNRNSYNKKSAEKLIIRNVYAYIGIKTARFYLYLGKNKLYNLGSCKNEEKEITRLYNEIKEKIELNQGILIDSHIGDNCSIRKTEEKGNPIKLYETGLSYKVVKLEEYKVQKFKSFGFTDKDICNLVGV